MKNQVRIKPTLSLTNFAMCFVGVVMLSLIPVEVFAQSTAGVKSIVKTFIDVVNVLFPAALVFGLLFVVFGYISDEPNKHQRLIYLIVAVAIWYGFSMIIGDIKQSFGGTGVIDSNIVK